MRVNESVYMYLYCVLQKKNTNMVKHSYDYVEFHSSIPKQPSRGSIALYACM